MKNNKLKITGVAAALAGAATTLTAGQVSTNSIADPLGPPARQPQPAAQNSTGNEQQNWNFHVQNTVIVQSTPQFAAEYSGAHSLNSLGETRETISLDLMGGFRLWRGAEMHADGLVWQGYGLSHTFGIDDFPNGDAYKAGTKAPNIMFSRLLLKQTIGFGGEQEDEPDGPLSLGGKQDISRLTITFGRMSALDIFDQNAYAGDPHSQFMNWATMANITWDYGQDTIGYGTGLTLELNQKYWAWRYLFTPMPPYVNFQNTGSGDGGDDQYLTYPNRGKYGPFLKSWSQAMELEGRYSIESHPGKVRVLAWLNEASSATYAAAANLLLAQGPNADLTSIQAYHYAYGFGLNLEQEVTQNIGLFSRLGWNDGKTQALEFSDANWSGSLGVSVKGDLWNRPEDTFGLAGIISGISKDNRNFLAAGGLGILDGDGALAYGHEKVMEVYYNYQLWKTIHFTWDFQYVDNPNFNKNRGPVPVFGGRLHWEF